MPIQTKHLVLYKNGLINPGKTLAKVINANLDQHFGEGIFKVTRVDFLSSTSANPFALSIRLKHEDHAERIKACLNQFHTVFSIDASIITLGSYNPIKKTTDIHLADPHAIIQLFKQLGYDSLLTEQTLCLSHNVDLMHLLIAETLHWIISQTKISNTPPELIEFGVTGNLSAIVVDPRGTRHKLEDTDEVCDFIKQYCKITLPTYFVALLKEQESICGLRHSSSCDSTKDQKDTLESMVAPFGSSSATTLLRHPYQRLPKTINWGYPIADVDTDTDNIFGQNSMGWSNCSSIRQNSNGILSMRAMADALRSTSMTSQSSWVDVEEELDAEYDKINIPVVKQDDIQPIKNTSMKRPHWGNNYPPLTAYTTSLQPSFFARSQPANLPFASRSLTSVINHTMPIVFEEDDELCNKRSCSSQLGGNTTG